MERQHAFQQLKQPCIQLLHVTASVAQKPSARKELVEALSSLLTTLQALTVKPGVLDAKLVEYAFVPISQVLRISRQVSVHALELCLESISTLLRAGWGGGLEPALSGQLLILFTFLAKPTSVENGITGTSEELQSLALKCASELLSEVSRTGQGRQAVTATPNIPALGEAVLVMLDSLTDSKSNSVKLQAITALRALTRAIADDDALTSFLPRIISSLTKVCSMKNNNRPSFRVIEQSLELFTSLLIRLLGDLNTKNLPNKTSLAQPHDNTASLRSVSWLHATVSQIKIALANVLKLRDHDKSEVRKALLKLCISIIQDCRISLSNCMTMAIETTISLAGSEGTQKTVENNLRVLLAADHNLSDLLRESLHGWIVSLPRLMQSKDDHSRRRILLQVSVTLRLFEQDPAMLDDRLADSLREGVSAIFSDSKGLEELTGTTSDVITDRTLMLKTASSLTFPLLRLRLKSQEDMIAEFKFLIQELAKSDSALKVAQVLVRSVDHGLEETRLASFWLAVNLIKDQTTTLSSFEDFIDLGTPNLREELLDDLYSHSLLVLNPREATTETPWQFSALALEAVALQARRYKLEFRAELSEVLYPVLHHLGSSNTALREHALTCLNIISKASGYDNAGELVVANVDYIVNAVGLKLAIGDVSPQAPQVLLMMMRLSGPSLLPYLDDLIGSIFDALERYHGYPKLAELLFSVLKGMVEEGVKAPQLALTASEESGRDHHPRKLVAVTVVDVVNTLKKLDADLPEVDNDDQDFPDEIFPERPWSEDATMKSSEQSDHTEEGPGSSVAPAEEPSPPAPRTFKIILKISELTQHYLTTDSPALRNSLLSLLRTTVPALAEHENSFLPLINTLWPVLLPRLQDPEAHVVSNALDTVTLLCEHAGDFMRTRIEDAWDVIRKVHRRTKTHTDNRSSSSSLKAPVSHSSSAEMRMNALSIHPTMTSSSFRPGSYVDAPTRMIWSSFVGLLCAISGHVTVQEKRFDEILDLLDPVLETGNVRQALETCNADAVWLRLFKKGKHGLRTEDTGLRNAHPKSILKDGSPGGSPHWQFVRL